MLRKKTFQNKIAASRYSLPVSATLIAMIWVAVGLLVGNIWAQFAMTVVSTLLMVELNNRNSLMRTYSRMVSCSFLAIFTTVSLPMPSFTGNIVTLCCIAFYLILWTGYQDRLSTGRTFYAFIFVGIASMAFVQTGYYLPLTWALMLFFVNSLSLRTFLASLLGVALPYWFAAGYYILTDTWQEQLSRMEGFIDYSGLLDYTLLSDHQMANAAFVTILAIFGSIHFLRNSYADKIRTRLIYESFIMMDVATLVFLILQPRHYNELIGIMVVNTAPLIAHFITFTRTKLTNIVFILMMIAAALLLCFNIFYPEPALL